MKIKYSKEYFEKYYKKKAKKLFKKIQNKSKSELRKENQELKEELELTKLQLVSIEKILDMQKEQYYVFNENYNKTSNDNSSSSASTPQSITTRPNTTSSFKKFNKSEKEKKVYICNRTGFKKTTKE